MKIYIYQFFDNVHQKFLNHFPHSKNDIPKKNLRPSLSMWRIDHKFPGAAANDMYNELMNTWESGTGLLQNSSSESAVELPLAGGS